SMRASQPDAAIYYLARMIESGEDPKFIARRMVIFASEDIGLAQPTALVVANAVFRAVETIGLPEASINLVHGVAYLSNCPKDKSYEDRNGFAYAHVVFAFKSYVTKRKRHCFDTRDGTHQLDGIQSGCSVEDHDRTAADRHHGAAWRHQQRRRQYRAFRDGKD